VGYGGTLGDEPFEARFRDLAADYDEMLFAIHTAAPAALVITVGYPFIVPEDTSKCTYGSSPAALKQFSTITHGDLGWLRTSVLERLNSVIEQETDIPRIRASRVARGSLAHRARLRGRNRGTGRVSPHRPGRAGRRRVPASSGVSPSGGCPGGRE